MFFNLINFIICSKECPPGINYFFDQTINVTLNKNEWYYFITSHMLREKPLVISVKSNKTASIYQTKNTDCPTIEDILLLNVENKKISKSLVTIYSDIGIVILGIYSKENYNNIILKLENQSPPKKILTPTVKIFIILFIMISLAIGFFFYVTEPKKVYEKID